jgi:hypothetical protein
MELKTILLELWCAAYTVVVEHRTAMLVLFISILVIAFNIVAMSKR